MSLTTRVNLFFLGVLALVLVGFTAGFYGLVRSHLHHQVDQRLQDTLAGLTAAVEVKKNGLEWEPEERRLTMGVDAGPEQVRWIIHDSHGKVVARSINLSAPGGERVQDSLMRISPGRSEASIDGSFTLPEGETWRLRSVYLQPDGSGSIFVPDPMGDELLYPDMVLTAAISLHPTEEALHDLLAMTYGLCLLAWIAAALVGRWVCRRALRPLLGMAETARNMPATELHHRLQVPPTHDELSGLALDFNGLLARVEDAFARQRRFTGEASHQLRTPLTALLGQIEVALRRERPAEEYRQTLERVARQGQQLGQIVEALLFLARADAEAALPDAEPIELSSWLREYLTGWSSHGRAGDLKAELGTSETWVAAPAGLLRQMMDNLLENAFKYSERGSAVAVRLIAEPGRSRVEIEDHGLGLSESEVEHLFEPFFRSPSARRLGLPGVGLGLAVVQRIASALGGKVSVKSKLGEGSVFSIELPLLKEVPQVVRGM